MDLKITQGITSAQIQELIKFSNTDELILKTTNDSVRFKNEKAVKDWMKKDRKIFTLTNSTEKLLGIIWFGIEALPRNKIFTEKVNPENYVFTFAIRLYDEARGKGNAGPFLNEGMKRFKKTVEFKTSKSKGFWLETFLKNERAIKTYSSFGFKKISNEDGNGKILMILD